MQIHKNFLKSIKHTPKKTVSPSRRKNPISRIKPPPKIQDKQLLVAQPTPLGFNFRLAAAILIPAIPTLIGLQYEIPKGIPKYKSFFEFQVWE